MKIIAFILSAILIFFGVIFILAAFGTPFSGSNLIIGLILTAIGMTIIGVITKQKKQVAENVYKVDLSTSTAMKKITCSNCGAPLDMKNMSLVVGVPTMKCPFCGVSNQMVEDPKW